MTEVRIAPIAAGDLAQVVAIHERAFADSAITALGAEAVRRYYLWLLEGPHDAALMGAWHGARLVGFCAAGVFRGAMNGFLRRNRRYLLAHLVTHPWLISSPLIRDRLVSAARITVRFSRRRQRTTAARAAAPSPSFGVLSIATDPEVRGAGAGRALMIEAEQRAMAQGFSRMVLTVHPDNTRAVQFYEALGWTREDRSGGWQGAMTRALRT